MKKLILFIFISFSFLFLNAQIYPSQNWSNFDEMECIDSVYTLVFSDEFDQDEIDTSKWFTHYRSDFPMDRLSQDNVPTVYLDENIIVEDGHCIIRSDHGPYTYGGVTRPYTSGVLFSKWEPRKRFKYGIYEMRAKVPQGDGFWPAFWLFGWCQNEIDIFELSNNDNIYRTDIHTLVPCDGKHERKGEKHVPPFRLSDDFHTYSLVWTPFKLIWNIDGVSYRVFYKYYRRTLFGWKGIECYEIDLIGKENVWKSQLFPFYDLDLIINMAFGTPNLGFGNKPVIPSSLPADYIIDYVRVYQALGYEDILGDREMRSDRFYYYRLKGEDNKYKSFWTSSDNIDLLKGNGGAVLAIPKITNESTGWIQCEKEGPFGPIVFRKEINIKPIDQFARSQNGRTRLFDFPRFN